MEIVNSAHIQHTSNSCGYFVMTFMQRNCRQSRKDVVFISRTDDLAEVEQTIAYKFLSSGILRKAIP